MIAGRPGSIRYNTHMRRLVTLVAMGLALGAAVPAWAQVQIETTRPVKPETGPEFKIVPPPLQKEETRPHDSDTYPGSSPRVEHEPAFIEPLAGQYETPTGSGRYGLAGWVSPNTPVGHQISNYHEVTGYFGLGFSITWDGPPPTRPPAKRPTPR